MFKSDSVNCIWFCAFELTRKTKEKRMLDLEVIPERSLGCDNWEFILGKYKQRNFRFDYLFYKLHENEKGIIV